ncbi:ATP-binding cassette domain-containing protein, partial [Faecalibaculum rodentium]
MDLVAYGGAALGMLLGILAWRTHTMSLFRVLFLILIASEFFLPMRALGSFFHIAMNGQAAAEKLFTILETVSRVPGTGIPDSLDIEARNLGWEYEPGHPVLQDVSLHIKPGASIGIAGQSGSGKSTLAALIRGRLSDSGVTIGGVPVPDIDPAWLQENLTVLDHHGFLFEGTIRDNLCLADPEAEDEQLVRVMKQAGINLPLDAPVRENGSNLSGGQRQRIALARALVKDAPVLILDEATSAVDAQSENAIMQAVKGLKDKTLIIISHRLVNLQDTREILVLDHGRPAGCASHDSLLKESPAYASLWNAQQELERYGKESA